MLARFSPCGVVTVRSHVPATRAISPASSRSPPRPACLCHGHPRALLPLRRGAPQVPCAADPRQLPCALALTPTPGHCAAPALARRRRDHLVANSIDEPHSHLGAIAQNVSLGHDEIRDLSRLDATELRGDAGNLGGANRKSLEGDVPRQPGGDRLSHVVEKLARALAA